MAETDEDVAEFAFASNQLTELSDLADAFIQKEVNADLFDELDSEYRERLVDSGGSEPPADVGEDEYESAIEVIELILDRMNAAER